MRGHAGHDVVEHALTALRNLDHRGAVGADPDVGDGAGILSQVPDEFLRAVLDVERRRPGRTPSATRSCRPTPPSGRPSSPGSVRWPPPRGCRCWPGATCR
ncbi:hypothetical protein GCM10025868_03130 [Angustibacter aerolatus]|uniref:Glutamine amidotransferase type-2 domain-containing protein n=1 Tax=Angustibacter aerolatus TaxID=1162965 RepID=A0ABQ6JA68_9ACTN|nr:hypothetical protein [Angustibacter aerolatus]GMA85063.1 hypothetical protein GCM10025868_03130 [Angustibacter aerolatus]